MVWRCRLEKGARQEGLAGGSRSLIGLFCAAMLSKLWNAAGNDAVGGHSHKKKNGVSAAFMAQYDGMSPGERKSRLAAIKCTGLVNGVRMAALSRPDF